MVVLVVEAVCWTRSHCRGLYSQTVWEFRAGTGRTSVVQFGLASWSSMWGMGTAAGPATVKQRKTTPGTRWALTHWPSLELHSAPPSQDTHTLEEYLLYLCVLPEVKHYICLGTCMYAKVEKNVMCCRMTAPGFQYRKAYKTANTWS